MVSVSVVSAGVLVSLNWTSGILASVIVVWLGSFVSTGALFLPARKPPRFWRPVLSLSPGPFLPNIRMPKATSVMLCAVC